MTTSDIILIDCNDPHHTDRIARMTKNGCRLRWEAAHKPRKTRQDCFKRGMEHSKQAGFDGCRACKKPIWKEK